MYSLYQKSACIANRFVKMRVRRYEDTNTINVLTKERCVKHSKLSNIVINFLNGDFELLYT